MADQKPRMQHVGTEIIWPQPGAPGAPPERRLVHGGSEASRRHAGEDADIAGPGHAEEFAHGTLHARHFHMPPEAREWPVERAGEPGDAVFLASERRATPLVRSIEQPDPGKAERGCDRFDLGKIRRPG